VDEDEAVEDDVLEKRGRVLGRLALFDVPAVGEGKGHVV